jgi:hypothetical protein
VTSCVAIAAAVIGAANAAAAHDAFAPEFDASKPVNLAGTVTRMIWANPRISIYLNVPEPGGTVATHAVSSR